MANEKRPHHESFHFSEVSKMYLSLSDESDRAVAMILASWIDDALTETIKRKLIADEKIFKEMFSHIGPLGTFSSRIGLGYLIGRFSRSVYDNLYTIRKIRNDFAHCRGDLQFTSQSINDRCKKLFLDGFTAEKSKSDFDPRKAFVATGICLLGFLIEFVSAETMSADGKEDYFPGFMNHMGEVTLDMIAGFAEQSVGHGAADNAESNG